jgi:hypothetical protein
LKVLGQGTLEIGVVADRGGCREQCRCGDGIGRRRIEGQAFAGAAADVFGGGGDHGWVEQISGEGPGRAEQRGDHPKIGEVLRGVFGGVVRAERVEQAVLCSQDGRVRVQEARLAGLVQAGAAGRPVAPGIVGGLRPAALGRVQGAVGGPGDQLPGLRLRMVAAGQRFRRNTWWSVQANDMGRCQIFFQGPPCCCWMGLPSAARQCGQ